MKNFSPVIIIPVYKHGKACKKVVESLSEYCKSFETKIILVDDGNTDETKNYLEETAKLFSEIVILIRLEKNSGKGGAFKAGINYAFKNGFTHALQLDADGQHDVERSKFFFEQAKLFPDSFLCGFPEYDETVPLHRKNGRKFANNWCKVVTWNSKIVDSLCGFRLYPIEKTYKLLKSSFLDLRMGFDIDILVRLIWIGIDFKFFPVKVTYPSDGFSNFHIVKDNIRISLVFTKLCIGMIFRIPKLIYFKIIKKN